VKNISGPGVRWSAFTVLTKESAMRNRLLLPLLAATTALIGGCAVYPAHEPHHRHDQVITLAPPPLLFEQPGHPPAIGFFWIAGYWNWIGVRYVWVPGRWEAPRPGYHWVPHRWEHDGRQWRPHGGNWERAPQPAARPPSPPPRIMEHQDSRPQPRPLPPPAPAPATRTEPERQQRAVPAAVPKPEHDRRSDERDRRTEERDGSREERSRDAGDAPRRGTDEARPQPRRQQEESRARPDATQRTDGKQGARGRDDEDEDKHPQRRHD
jgi:hypothetical protein